MGYTLKAGGTMIVNSWLMVLAIFLIFLLIVHVELRLEAEQHYWECYLHMNSKGKADKYRCKGVSSSERCKKCPYYKKYLKEVENE